MDALVLGLTIGLAAGISPGPLLALVVSTTLRSGWRAGALAACGPLVTDAIVVAGVLAVLQRLPHTALNVLGVVGGAGVVWTGVGSLREARTATLDRAPRRSASGRRALIRAATVNLLSPHPWIAWATALGPLVLSTWRRGAVGGVALVAGFYLALVGTKVVVAVLVAGGRRRLTDAGYRRALLGAAVLLIAAGVALIVEFCRNLS